MTINVSQISLSELITVQSGYTEDGEFIMEFCNHDGKEQETITRNAGMDDEFDVDEIVCDKCGKTFDLDGEELIL